MSLLFPDFLTAPSTLSTLFLLLSWLRIMCLQKKCFTILWYMGLLKVLNNTKLILNVWLTHWIFEDQFGIIYSEPSEVPYSTNNYRNTASINMCFYYKHQIFNGFIKQANYANLLVCLIKLCYKTRCIEFATLQ